MQNVKPNRTLNLKNFSKFLDSLSFLKNKSTIAVAVSAGVDSMCLLYLSNIWAKKNDKDLYIVSYNHNIRKESSDEVKYVSIISKKLGWRHKILKWNSPSKKNILEEARTARYLAISEFCKKENIDVLLLGHHQDDLIETFFMRVIKKSRIDGLCPMVPHRKLFGINLVRPLLKNSKNDIYSYAKMNKVNFYEDPTNKNNTYLRTQIRMYLEKNNELKFKLSKSADLFCKVRKYFDHHTSNFFHKKITFKDEGYLIIKKEKLLKLPEFLIFRILNKGIIDIGNRKYPLRSRVLINLNKILFENVKTTMSVGGCLVKNQKETILIIREFNYIKNLKLVLSEGKEVIWDNKFLISNLSEKIKLYVTPFGKELENRHFQDFYNSKRKFTKKLSFEIKKSLPVIKTLEGYIYIPHLNIYNSVKLKSIVNLRSIDYFSIII